jgi:pimeloyl-ACP methyl ester carboxylesterase
MRVPLSVRVLPPVAYRAWFTPPRPGRRAAARDANRLKTVEPIAVTVDGRSHAGFATGEGPLVILAHGWGGRAAQMLDLARAAARAGYRAVAIDAPGHNRDEQRTSDGFQMAAGLEAVEERFGSPTAVIAHSLGAMTSMMAWGDRPPKAAVWLAPVLDVRSTLQMFARRAQLAPWTGRLLGARVKRFAGDSWPVLSAGADADLPGAELLILHDPDDPDADFTTSAALARRRSSTRLIETPDLGHYSLLREPEVTDTVERFLAHSRTNEVELAGTRSD